jgi:hypothetical protein
MTLNLSEFGETLQEFNEVDPDNGLEAIAMMHEYHRSRQTQDAWQVYEALGMMIERVEAHDEPEGAQFTEKLPEMTEFESFQGKRRRAVEILEGI